MAGPSTGLKVKRGLAAPASRASSAPEVGPVRDSPGWAAERVALASTLESASGLEFVALI